MVYMKLKFQQQFYIINENELYYSYFKKNIIELHSNKIYTW